MRIIHCTNCGGDSTSAGGTMADIKLTRHKYCKACHNNEEKSLNLHFCSPECMVNFITAKKAEYDAKVEEFVKKG